MQKKMLSMKEKQGVREKIVRTLNARGTIVFAYIFGSFASNESFSDIDVGAFVSDPHAVSPLKTELELEAELEEAVRMPVDVRIINNAPLTFVYHVLKGGMVIVDKDRSLRADFEGLIYKKYFDFQHLRREYLREIAHAPV